MNDNPQPDTTSENPGGATVPQAMNEFAQAIKSWADTTSTGDSKAAQQAAIEAFNFASAEAHKNPTTDFLLKQEADDLESQGKWSEAEAVRLGILDLAETKGDFGRLARAQMDLCGLLRLLGRVQEASHWAGAAITSARRTDLFPLVVMALGYEVSCALDRGDTPGALAAASEILQLIEPGKMYDPMRAKALTIHAKCLLANGDPVGAARDLAAGWELLKAQSGSWMMTMPGPVGAMANWWEIKSQLEERQGNLASAHAALTEAINYRRQADCAYARLALAKALDKLGEISKAVGDVAAGEQARSEAQSIRRDLQLPIGT